MSSSDTLCKRFGPRSDPTKCRVGSGSKLFDTLVVFPGSFFFEKVDFEEKISRAQNYPVGKELNGPEDYYSNRGMRYNTDAPDNCIE